MITCSDGNHIVGYRYEMHEGASEVDTNDVKLRPLRSDWDDIFSFCPYCGEALEWPV